jgi:hypothetical protein
VSDKLYSETTIFSRACKQLATLATLTEYLVSIGSLLTLHYPLFSGPEETTRSTALCLFFPLQFGLSYLPSYSALWTEEGAIFFNYFGINQSLPTKGEEDWAYLYTFQDSTSPLLPLKGKEGGILKLAYSRLELISIILGYRGASLITYFV